MHLGNPFLKLQESIITNRCCCKPPFLMNIILVIQSLRHLRFRKLLQIPDSWSYRFVLSCLGCGWYAEQQILMLNWHLA